MILYPGTVAGQRHSVAGRILEGETVRPVAGASVSLADRTVTTDADGTFRFVSVPNGRYVLSVSSIGYVKTDTVIVVHADMTLTLSLLPDPVRMEALAARARFVSARGVVKDSIHDVGLMNLVVRLGSDRQAETDLLGRFRFDRVPAGVPTELQVSAFGYLPRTMRLELAADTTLSIRLQEDPVAMRMIQVQLARLEDRAEGYRYEVLPVLGRAELLSSRDNGVFLDVLRLRLGEAMFLRISCAVIDEKRANRWRLASLLPDEVYHAEITEVPGGARRLMLRVYTTEFVQDMVRGRAELVHRDASIRTGSGRCQ